MGERRSPRERDDRDSRLIALAVRLGVNAVALWLAAALVPGFDIHGWQSLLATAAIFALVINAAMLALAVWIGDQFGLEVELDGFWAAFFAALLVSVASWLLNAFAGRPLRRALK